ncbi:hypothetical protein DMH18_25990 [Streptomyces sp. WAC 06783]|uniref:hypothetical protein n=1 Tax=Streptomyces sp. WAC 06783 TaxID=2203211 RepID=UPI000F73B4CA|nr:hypothetical protein [Streptomyces sp. WAC 06783]RSO06909.1 hypothetical protein DMH18_25990 [Streptomyces sp. WAC 06783]
MKVKVEGNERSTIIVAAGSVTMTGKQLLPVTPISETDLHVVRTAWVSTGSQGEPVTAVTTAAALLASEGPALAVVAGPPGYGKRTAGVRALWEAARAQQGAEGQLPALQEIRPDWDDPEAPDPSVLPEEAGTGYLLDVAAEIGTWKDPVKVATALVAYAETLRRKRSFMVVVSDERGWPEGASGTLAHVVARATVRPDARRVAIAHLEHVHYKRDRLAWLRTDTSGAEPAGTASHLLSRRSSPGEAVRLAAKLAAAEYSPQGLKDAVSEFQEWHDEIKKVFDKTQNNADDRALLIASIFLSGEDALTVQSAARKLLGEGAEQKVRTILTGPDLTARFESVHARVEERCASLDYKPGYARAVLLHLWQQRPDIHQPLLAWLSYLTSPQQPGAKRLGPISDLLVELAKAQNDIRVIDKIRDWIDHSDATEHLKLIARVLATAAEADALGPTVRARLLKWSQNPATSVAKTVALVCQTTFADRYPHQALVRLRHILGRTDRDTAVTAAEQALRSMADQDHQLPLVWDTISKWAVEPRHLAGHRAFLSLLDPSTDPFALRVMLAAAEKQTEVKEALIQGWSAVLSDERVNPEAGDLLIAWAHARANDDLVPADLVTDILRQVVGRHLMSTPISALVFGEPDVRYDAAVIDLRKELQLPTADVLPTAGSPWRP